MPAIPATRELLPGSYPESGLARLRNEGKGRSALLSLTIPHREKVFYENYFFIHFIAIFFNEL